MRNATFFALLLGTASMITNPVAMANETDGNVSTSPSTFELQYPETRKLDLVEEQFGEKVADPYRWLENDVREDGAVADWVDAQNAVTNSYLDTLPGRNKLAERMTAFFNYERFGLPRNRGDKYFYTKNDGLQNQSVLYVRDGLKGSARQLIDPNGWASDGATALAGWVPSDDGSLLLYSIQDGGSDWRTIQVLDVSSGKVLDDKIEWVKFSGLSWIGNEGFLYSRFPEPESGAEFQSLNLNQKVYFHKIGTPQSDDVEVFATPENPKIGNSARVTSDNQWVVLTSSIGTDEKYEISVINIGQQKGQRDWAAKKLVSGFKNDWQLIDSVDGELFFLTDMDAPRLRIVSFDMDNIDGPPREIVPEQEATLAEGSIVGDKLIVSYLENAKSLARMLTLDGKPAGEINLANIGRARGFGGKPGKSETFYSFSSFTQPGAVYRLDTSTGKTEVFSQPDLAFDPKDYVTRQVFYPSKDGTKVPMFIVHRKDVDLSDGAPTLLYGYGGFNISLTPGFSATRLAWMDAGGVFAMANLRGGGKYGKIWHDGGRLQNKQNVFDDFIAAGEYLIAQGITGKNQLAIEGRSNGGLLIGAVSNQRPDLFAAGHAAVGVMDMLRFDRFTAGRYWVDDYGYPNREEDFKTLFSYSPYHNITNGAEYPALIVSTADTDDRVVPGHSFKYTAALQAAQTGDAPKIIRIETRAGHGSGKPTDKVIEEFSDIFAFLAFHTGLKLEK